MRVRLRFTKHGKVRFLSHRDVARVWERSLRRAAVPVAYSEGFSPRPKLSFGLALSTGHESRCEFLDVHLAQGADVDLDELPARLDEVLPPGLAVTGAVELAPGADSLQQEVTSCEWEIDVRGPTPAEAARAVEAALAAHELPVEVERKGRWSTVDARPAILALAVADGADGVGAVEPAPTATARLFTELATQPRSLRTSELLRALDPGWVEVRTERIHQWISTDGARREPAPEGSRGATSTPHAVRCAG